ncbi:MULTISPECIES: protein phosphatase CheZ [Alteromonadaceae]|uniref:protein phosphatase CheZ n=1 Tax=Alteromonadaceae TaxID=72275 RepID=UPI001C0A20AD|nr:MULTISPECIES: protein phosphatase CheZ [Aliiglaciecola]MBU2879807.1 protein phosphatase CheZ [Aliiglaciecola lipolytica]MDO6709914.1 protein phosphatase CheZ [Aliiglaciecola sp. 2_MG-2023]MDO6751062.1 protein phosphatase CheZ [Aliiglaciecola sp. 1_MG-2023]
MTGSNKAPMSLDDAKKLVELLESGDNQAASELLEEASLTNSVELFAEVGKLTRQLHDSLNSFQLDDRISNLANEEIPDAQSRLNYVIETTEKAANTTMDAVEASMPIAEKLHTGINNLLPEWKKLMTRQLQLGEFKSLCSDLDGLLEQSSKDTEQLTAFLTDILMAQGYQDITGQVIRRVIELVKEVEDSLVHMLTVFGASETSSLISKADENAHKSKAESDTVKAEGPIIDAEIRDDVVSNQDDVDDLLSSLGF